MTQQGKWDKFQQTDGTKEVCSGLYLFSDLLSLRRQVARLQGASFTALSTYCGMARVSQC